MTGDDLDERIVFEVAAEEALGLTDAEILEQIWNGKLDIIFKVLDGAGGLESHDAEAPDNDEENEAEVILWEEAFSGKEGTRGNLAVCNYTYSAAYVPCLLRYDNEVSDGKGCLWMPEHASWQGKFFAWM